MKTTFAVNWRYGVATHSGWFRMINEDRSLLRIGSTDSGKPYAAAVIADGMGGSGDGGRASELAIEAVKLWLDQQVPALLGRRNVWSELAASADRLFRGLNGQLIEQGELAGSRIGTTLTLLFLLNETYFLCHVGDCRVYITDRNNRLRQLSRDQTWISEQVRKGRLSKGQARKHPKRNVLLQCLGMQKELQLVKRTGFYTQSSLFLLCSDGFYDRLPDQGIERFLHENGEMHDLQSLSDRLVDKALDNRSNDNISVLLLRPARPVYSYWKRWIHRCKNFYILFPVQWRK